MPSASPGTPDEGAFPGVWRPGGAMVEIFEGIAQMRSASRAAKARGQTVGCVPTMGYLHAGHMALVQRARELSDWVVVTLFVNPTQFGPNEDLARYPRDFDRDCALCLAEGVDAMFAPDGAEMYPPGAQTFVTVEELSRPLCGVSRPGHFRGVATVVAKLFHIVEPDVAVFGEKDYQQLRVIRQMVRDLDMPVEIVGVPTVREPDGLALSSRNKYLSPEERGRAVCLSRALAAAQAAVSSGERRAAVVLKQVAQILSEGEADVDYAELRDADSLLPVTEIEARTVLAIAARIGTTRLIDNRVLVPA